VRVAILGTGIMGFPMARNMARAGLEVRAWNRTREKAEPLRDDGLMVAESPAAAANGADVIVTILSDADATTAVMAGPAGAASAMPDTAVWAQMATLGLSGIERCAAIAEERGIALVDAPVLGTRKPAEDGELVVLAGGSPEALERCRPVFEAVGRKVVECGEVGAGTRLKLVLNNWVLALVEAVAETIALAEALNIDPARFLETIEGAPMDSPYAQLKGKAILERKLEPSFSLKLARKDVALVIEAAQRHGLDLALPPAIARSFDRAIELGHGDEDMAAAYFASAP
jgi:3-hydroxyisobutyrate dehydrogenase